MRISIGNMDCFKKAIKALENRESAVMKVAAMSINRAATHSRAQIVKMGREDYTMPAKALRERIEIKKANMRSLEATITVSGKTISLERFQTKVARASRVQRSKGGKRIPLKIIQVMVKRSGGFKQLPHAFKAKGKFGPGIFVRTSKARVPLRALQGPSPAGIMRNTANFSKIKQSTHNKLLNEFQRGLKYALDKGRIAQGDYL